MFSIIISITSAPTHERASTDSNSKLKGVKPLFDKILKESVSHYFVCFEQEIVLKIKIRAFFLIILMPQLIPFYFLNQLYFSFIALFVLVYILSKYFLPLFTLQQVIRIFIVKLNNKS